MPKHTYEVNIDGFRYQVDSDAELSDVQAYQAAKSTHESPQPLDPNEPDTYAGGFFKGLNEGVQGATKGLKENLLPEMVKGITSIPAGLVGLGKIGLETLGGVGNLATAAAEAGRGNAAPLQQMMNQSGEDAKSIFTEKIPAALHGAVRLARTDPEAFGAEAAKYGGQAADAALLAGVSPLTPAPVARVVGKTMSDLGGFGKWGFRIAGAHAVLSGNPAGVLMLGAPPLLQGAGKALQRFGTPVGAAAETIPGKFLQIRNDLSTGAVPATELLDQLGTMEEDLVARSKAAKLPDENKALITERNQIDQLKGQIKKAIKKGGNVNPATAYEAEIRARNPTMSDAKVADAVASLSTIKPGETVVGGHVSTEPVKRAAPASPARFTSGPDAVVRDSRPPLGEDSLKRLEALNRAMKEGGTAVGGHGQASMDAYPQVPAEGATPLQQSMLKAEPPAKMSIEDLPANKTRSQPLSKINKGLSLTEEADVLTALGLPPGTKLKAIQIETGQQILANRAARAMAKRWGPGASSQD